MKLLLLLDTIKTMPARCIENYLANAEIMSYLVMM